MIKYIVDNQAGNLISLDTENLSGTKVLRSEWVIDRTYIADKDGEVLIKDDDGNIANRLDVKANDVIVKLYSPTGDNKKEIVILSGDEIRDHIIRKKEFEAKQREENKTNKHYEDCVACSCKEKDA